MAFWKDTLFIHNIGLHQLDSIEVVGVSVGKIKSLNLNSNLKLNLDRIYFEISNSKM